MIDEYAQSAEFIDLLITPFWTGVGPVLVEAVKDTDPATGPVVDVGAGSGCGTVLIGNAMPTAEIFAVEPSPGLRAALLAKVNADASLRRRVTVVSEGFLQAALPDQWSLVIAVNVIGHFTSLERQQVWRLLAERLTPNGRAVVNLQPPSEPVSIPESLTATAQVGRRRYDGWSRAEPTGEETVTWHMTYRIHQDDAVVDERAVSYAWHLLTEQRMGGELAQVGLRARRLAPAELGVYVITRESQ